MVSENTLSTSAVKNNHESIWIYLLAIASVALHLVFTNNLEYHRDEMLYFSLGEHPAFGYNTVPPMIGWIAWLMQNIFGFSLLAVRLFPALLSGVMVLLLSKMTRELGGNFYACLLAGIGFIISGFGLRSYMLFMPVCIDVFFWTLIIYLVIRYINTNSDKYLILLGCIAGLSLLNKYMTALLIFCLLAAILFTKFREVFRNRNFWIGVLGGFIIFLPNLVWQFVHGLPVFGHFAELSRTQLAHVRRIDFIIDQIILLPALASVLSSTGLVYLMIDKNMKKFRVLGITVLMVIMVLLILRGKSYYTIGVFPFLISAGAVSFASWMRLWLKIALPAILIGFTWFILPMGVPVYKADGLVKYCQYVETKFGITLGRRWEDGFIHPLPQDYADMLGWQELTAVASKAYNMVTDKKSCFIYCENYGQAGAITIIGKKYHLPEAISFNESFKYWIPKKFDPDIKTMIYINDEMGEDVKTFFKKITIVGRIENPNAREYGTTVYLCEDPIGSFNEFWAKRIKDIR